VYGVFIVKMDSNTAKRFRYIVAEALNQHNNNLTSFSSISIFPSSGTIYYFLKLLFYHIEDCSKKIK